MAAIHHNETPGLKETIASNETVVQTILNKLKKSSFNS